MIKNDLKVYMVNDLNEQYRLRVYEDVSYSQVYTEEAIRVKTLHNPEYVIDEGITSGKNPGNFNFTIPIMDSTTAAAIFGKFIEVQPTAFDLYLEENSVIKHLSSCVVSGIVFNFDRNSVITATVSGTYSDTLNAGSVPGTPTSDPAEIHTYIESLDIQINSVPIPYINSVSVELSNNVQWTNNRYLHDIAPQAKTDFYCSGQVISGNFVQNTDMSSPAYYDNATLSITIGFGGSELYKLNLGSAIITERPQLAPIIKKGYDFRANANSLNEIRYKGSNLR